MAGYGNCRSCRSFGFITRHPAKVLVGTEPIDHIILFEPLNHYPGFPDPIAPLTPASTWDKAHCLWLLPWQWLLNISFSIIRSWAELYSDGRKHSAYYQSWTTDETGDAAGPDTAFTAESKASLRLLLRSCDFLIEKRHSCHFREEKEHNRKLAFHHNPSSLMKTCCSCPKRRIISNIVIVKSQLIPSAQ